MSTLRKISLSVLLAVLMLVALFAAYGNEPHNGAVKSAPENVTYCYSVRNIHMTYNADYVKRTVLQTDGTYMVSYVPTSGTVTHIGASFNCIDYVK